MSVLDLSILSPEETILHYVLECKNRGNTLPYTDLEVIDEWLQRIEHDSDALLLILSEILPQYFEKSKRAHTLRGVKRKVLRKIREYTAHKHSTARSPF